VFGTCGSGTILVLPGHKIMVLVTAGAPPFCRAEYECCGGNDPHTWLVILLFVAPVAPYNCRTRRKDRVWFDLGARGGGNDPRTWLVILLFVAPVAKGHTIVGRGGRIVFGSILVRVAVVMILVLGW